MSDKHISSRDLSLLLARDCMRRVQALLREQKVEEAKHDLAVAIETIDTAMVHQDDADRRERANRAVLVTSAEPSAT